VYIPNSAGAQFFINLGDNRRLDENFTVFGRVVWGMETVLVTEVGDVIKRAYIINPL
jgi:cyclophilin family peptidyl-prolyl cis-trans isomerase